MPKVILDLCGGTGAWSKPYVDKGYNVKLITLPQYDITKAWCDARFVYFPQQVEKFGTTVVPLVQVHGILAAPPCTEFSLANTRQQYALRPNWQEELLAVSTCEQVIRACMAKGYTKFWALENPFGHLRKFLGAPEFSFRHWEFVEADDSLLWTQKRTEVWGYFTQPKPLRTEMPQHLGARDYNRNNPAWYSPKCPEQYAHLKLTRSDIRAITPAGFAAAFCKANR